MNDNNGCMIQEYYDCDVRKILSPIPKTIFDAIAQCSKLEQIIFDAWHIMETALQFKDDSEMKEVIEGRMRNFVVKYSLPSPPKTSDK